MGSTLWSTLHAASCRGGSGRSWLSGTRASSYGRPSRVVAIVNRTIAVCLEHRNTVAAQPAPPNSLHAYCRQRALATRTGRPVAFSAVIGRASMGELGAASRVGGGAFAALPAPRAAAPLAPRGASPCASAYAALSAAHYLEQKAATSAIPWSMTTFGTLAAWMLLTSARSCGCPKVRLVSDGTRSAVDV